MNDASPPTGTTELEATLKTLRARVEDAMDRLVPAPGTRPERLHRAMRHSLEAGGKRLRPILLVAAHNLFPSSRDPLPAAVAVECLHTYSLIHDDLPCMDNSDLRRGQPTCHVAFDEETALLAGDALLTFAFELLGREYQGEVAGHLVAELGSASGSQKLVGGQMEDLLGEKCEPTPDALEFIHRNKTAALLTACLRMGLMLSSKGDAQRLALMADAGLHLGMAFQIIDDILDVTTDAATLGKGVGQDENNHKMTYPALFGLEASREKAHAHTEAAITAFEQIGGNNTLLIALARHMQWRIN
ncbi:MAG: polyprenyl synthetase family protein [Opitutales bacterium]